MRRVWLGQTFLLGALITLAMTARFSPAADLPYTGAWKITVLLRNVDEISFWLVKIDKAGKKVELVSGVAHYQKTAVSAVKADADAIRFQLKTTTPNGLEDLVLIAHPPKGKDSPETLKGVILAGTNFIPVQLDKTDQTTIDPKKAMRRVAGVVELQAAVDTKDVKDRIKDLEDVLKMYEGKPIAFLTGRILLGELVKQKVGPDAFKPVATAYVKTAAAYGREMKIQAHSDVVRLLVNYDKSAPWPWSMPGRRFACSRTMTTAACDWSSCSRWPTLCTRTARTKKS